MEFLYRRSGLYFVFYATHKAANCSSFISFAKVFALAPWVGFRCVWMASLIAAATKAVRVPGKRHSPVLMTHFGHFFSVIIPFPGLASFAFFLFIELSKNNQVLKASSLLVSAVFTHLWKLECHEVGRSQSQYPFSFPHFGFVCK